MIDPRIEALASQVINYSVSLARGERVLIDVWDGADNYATALVAAAYRAGGIPFVTQQSTEVTRAVIQNATEESMAEWYKYQVQRMQEMDAYIVVRKKENVYALCDLPVDKLAIYNKYYGKLHNTVRIPHTKWCVLRYPNHAMAQLAKMSTSAFEDYFYKACCLDYKKLCEIAAPLNQLAAATDQVRIISPGTDLTFSIRGMCRPYPRCGLFNIPCGETGMPVVADSVNGTISYNIPTEYQGTYFTDIRFRFKDGVIIEAQANDSIRLNQILDTDANARRIGEFAMGYNPYINEPILDTLFDEKMARTIHFTPGNSIVNPSGIHWDIVQSHAAEMGGGEIWFDGQLIRKDGLFVLEQLKSLNPEQLIKILAV